MRFLPKFLGGKTAEPNLSGTGVNSGGLWTGFMGQVPWVPASTIWKPVTIADMEVSYSRHPIVRACVKIIATTAAVPRMEIGAWRNGEWEPVVRHPIMDLLDNPNQYYSKNDIIQYLVARYVLTGWGYLWKIRNTGRSAIGELWPIPSSWVTPQAGTGTNLFSGFKVFGQEAIVPEEDMAFVSQIDPASTACASAAIQAAIHDYQLDLSRQDYQAEMLTNLKVPGVAIKSERGFTPAQKETMREDYKDRYGLGHRGDGPFFVEGNGAIELINPLADMDWPGLTGLSETRLCVSFGVPPMMIHCRAGLDRATYSNLAQADVSLHKTTMLGHWRAIEDGLTLGLLRREGEFELLFRFRYDELPQFQEDADKVNLRVLARFQAGIISRDEARMALDYDPDPVFEAAQVEREKQMALMADAIQKQNAANDANADKADEKPVAKEGATP